MKIWMQGAVVGILAVALGSSMAHAQIDVALSGLGTFTSGTTGFGTQETPSNSGGALLEVRRIVKPLVGYEFNYSFNIANETYSPLTSSCFPVCSQPTLKVDGKANQFGANWVVSMNKGNIRPFALGGIAMKVTVPGYSTFAVRTVSRAAYVFGAGVDWNVNKHWGVRLQARGNLTKAPNLSAVYTSTTKYTEIYEPTAGVFYRF